MTPADLARLEGGRWEILRACHVAGHLGATETMLFNTLIAMWPQTTRSWIRDQLAYLESRGLIVLKRHEVNDWRAMLDRYGWDVATYVVDCEAGIRRPPKYWGSAADPA